MAKRKGNRILKPLTFSSDPSPGDPILDFRYHRLSFSLTNKDLQRLESDYRTGTISEEALSVLDDLAGGDIDAYFSGTGGDSVLNEANALLDGIDDTSPPEVTRDASEAALAMCDYCYDARVLMAAILPYDEGIVFYQEGVELAEKQFKDVLPELGQKGELWRHRPARDYLRFLRDLIYYQMMHQKLDDAIATTKEVLDLDQNDHQGLRQTLFLLLLIKNQRAELAEWIGKYPHDWLLGTHVALAGMKIMEEVDSLPEETRKEIISSSEKKRRKLIVEKLPLSVAAIRELEARSPYICTFLSSSAIVEFPECEAIHYQRADEAVETARSFFAFWQPFFFPLELLYSVQLSLPQNPDKRDLRIIRDFYKINSQIMQGG